MLCVRIREIVVIRMKVSSRRVYFYIYVPVAKRPKVVFEKSQMDFEQRIIISVYWKGIQEWERYLIVNVQVFERLYG
jgi:hypothetical protein